jgi:uncharacterized membrane protein
MATVIGSDEGMAVGRVFNRGFGVIMDNPVTVLGVAFLLGALPSLVLNLLERPLMTSSMDRYQTIGGAAISILSFLFGLGLMALVQGSLVRATLAYVRGERATIGECIGASLSVVLPLVGLIVVMVVAVFVGFMFLFVPGVILYVMWSVASPALVAERTGVFGALGRSRELTKGARWKVFGIEVILIIAYYIFAGVIGAALVFSVGINLQSLPTTGLPIGWILVTVIMSTVVNTVWSTVQTSLYVELRNWKEGLPEQALEDVFA